MAMLKLTILATAALIAVIPQAGQAQSTRRGEIIVYGDDPCPRATDDEVTICRRRPAEERYRIPEAYRPAGTRQQSQSWSAQSRAMTTIGATGTNSCSPVGPGGWTGCLQQQINQAKQEAEEAKTADTAPAR